MGVCHKNNLVKAVGAVLFSSCFYSVLISGSRGGLVGLVFMGIILVFFSKHRLLMGLGCAFVLVLAVKGMGSKYQAFMATILDLGGSDVSADSRITGLRNGIEMLIKRPILGVGPGCYPIARKMWFGWGLWSHNHYGQLMGDLGILGTIAWFGFLYKYLNQACNMRKIFQDNPLKLNIANAIIGSTAIRLALGMFSHSLYLFLWYMLAGVAIVMARMTKIDKKS